MYLKIIYLVVDEHILKILNSTLFFPIKKFYVIMERKLVENAIYLIDFINQKIYNF